MNRQVRASRRLITRNRSTLGSLGSRRGKNFFRRSLTSGGRGRLWGTMVRSGGRVAKRRSRRRQVGPVVHQSRVVVCVKHRQIAFQD